MGSILLLLAEESHMPVQGCNFSVQPNFSKQVLLVTGFTAPVSKSVEIWWDYFLFH